MLKRPSSGSKTKITSKNRLKKSQEGSRTSSKTSRKERFNVKKTEFSDKRLRSKEFPGF
jgi:hypothetical protein